MTLINKIGIKNLKCFRREVEFELANSNFFIGVNNAGKSAVLKAMHCFFVENAYDPTFINQTEFRSKGSGYNKSSISLTFDFDNIEQKTLGTNLANTYGRIMKIYKNFTYREVSETVVVDYTIDSKDYIEEELSSDLLKLLKRISVSYLHPQEAKELLVNAQEKLKNRLLSNWGRNAQLAGTLKELQLQWTELRKKANSYLSSGLTQSLQNIWPGCSTKVDLPEKIEDVIAISEILFKASSGQPDISLTSQGTGAQSTILYQTHYLLDSDKTLHRGFYLPIWLIEEPESFLHADIIFKLGYLLSSDEWLTNIQMLVSTHSPLLLATTKSNAHQIFWYHLSDHEIVGKNKVSEWTDEEIQNIGILMGDPNFDIYFRTSDRANLFVIEDKREITKDKLIEAGIQVTHILNGSTEQRRYFDVLRSIDINMGRSIFFLVDNDDGFAQFRNVMDTAELIKTTPSGIRKYKFKNNVFMILLPENHAIEELFEAHDPILESCANQIFNSDHTNAAVDANIPANLSRAHAYIRNRTVNGLDEAKQLIRNQQDVKDIFWNKVQTDDLKISSRISGEIIDLILITPANIR